jgi:hypothetical protein
MTPWHSHSLTHHHSRLHDSLSLSHTHTHSLTIKRLSNTLTKGGRQEIKKLIQHSNSNYSLQNLSHPILVEDDTVSAVYKDVIQDLLWCKSKYVLSSCCNPFLHAGGTAGRGVCISIAHYSSKTRRVEWLNCFDCIVLYLFFDIYIHTICIQDNAELSDSALGTCVLFLYFGTVLATPLAGKLVGWVVICADSSLICNIMSVNSKLNFFELQLLF